MGVFINILKVLLFGTVCTAVFEYLGFPMIACICVYATLLVIAGFLWITAFESAKFSFPCRLFLSSVILLIPSTLVQRFFPIEFPINYVLSAITGISFIIFLGKKLFFDTSTK